MVSNLFPQTDSSVTRSSKIDEGLRAYLIKIYNYMTMALVISGIVAYFSAQSEAFLNAMYVIENGTVTGMKPLAWLVVFAPLALVIYLGFAMWRMSIATAQITYWIYAVIMGLSLSVVFLTFTGESISQVFFITAATFGGMSLYGYTAKRDLTGAGSFLIMGLWGLIIAMVINLFLKSSSFQFALSAICVLIFIGLTAYDTQKLKQTYYQYTGSGEAGEKTAIIGALTLYLDFINIFLNLLTLIGHRK